eukprot:TRINITY_DN15890_c0_g1_i1.p1 TRINITY_DN15890_c0_g1~~TRINITY_DN15890_c0_g1_i1.p1  ORF type:complete len:102 (-),score=8.27 TRINITY_DN15890_c0_g1_i1:7-312(-)
MVAGNDYRQAGDHCGSDWRGQEQAGGLVCLCAFLGDFFNILGLAARQYHDLVFMAHDNQVRNTENGDFKIAAVDQIVSRIDCRGYTENDIRLVILLANIKQ